jgi:hypothetical protein
MSLQLAAQHLATRGRGPDTTLVHMAPQEVAGLQALAKAHGGTLTVNPDTGLPEAGFLSSILPMVAGAALAATGVGAPMAALMVGGGSALATGSLKKGLMAGLGAYGGAGIAGGLMGAGAAGAAEAGMAGAGLNAAGAVAPEAVAANLGVQGAATGAGSQAAMLAEQAGGFGLEGLSSLQNAAAVPGTALVAPQNVVSSIAKQVPTTTAMPQLSAQGIANQAAADATKKYMEGSMYDRFGSGAGALMDAGGRDAFMQSVGGTKGLLQYGLAGLAPMMQDPRMQAEREREYPQYYSFDAGRLNERSGSGNYFNPTLTRIPTQMADGGIASLAQGGQGHLGDYSDGGRLLRGPGDGVSDDIPATIGGKQPARLADGEFVVPARIVSELGNGSTEAGARKLYAMMDRVQAARKKSIGKDRVAVNSRSEKMLPA